MFLHLSVGHSVHRGKGVSPTESPRDRDPWRDSPGQRPPGQRPPDRDPPGQRPPDRDSPEERPHMLTSEQYASYWNAFLFFFSVDSGSLWMQTLQNYTKKTDNHTSYY